VVISKAAWINRHANNCGRLMMKPWEQTNQLKVQTPLRDELERQLMALMHTLLLCFEDPNAKTLPISKPEIRHQAAIELLHWCAKNPKTTLKIEDISSEVF